MIRHAQAAGNQDGRWIAAIAIGAASGGSLESCCGVEGLLQTFRLCRRHNGGCLAGLVCWAQSACRRRRAVIPFRGTKDLPAPASVSGRVGGLIQGSRMLCPFKRF